MWNNIEQVCKLWEKCIRLKEDSTCLKRVGCSNDKEKKIIINTGKKNQTEVEIAKAKEKV